MMSIDDNPQQLRLLIFAKQFSGATALIWCSLQAWRVAHPPVRGHHWMFSRPLVHVGFLKSWLAGGFNEKVVGRIMELVHATPADPNAKPLRIYITGRPSQCT